MAEKNKRYELRAYESTNCCRLASFLLQLAGDEPPKPVVDRDAVAELWAEQYPRHAEATGRRNVRGRITRALTLLKVASIALPEDDRAVRILDHDLLGMVASNLPVVEDDQGMAIPPGSWAGRPNVPEHLLDVQQMLIDQQMAQKNAVTQVAPTE